MTRYFNTEGACNPREHYMVRLNDKLYQIKTTLVDRKKYFVINKGRQYGKTTTLNALEKYLKDEYIVIALDFQLLGTGDFADEATFAGTFAKVVIEAFDFVELDDKEELLRPLTELVEDREKNGLNELFVRLSRMCARMPKPVVLMIDEVDSASNNQVFIDFLAQLRGYYLKRDKTPIFHSVILAGVYDIRLKNIHFSTDEFAQRRKFTNDLLYGHDSPWNIAADFEVEMSFMPDQIARMLEEYEADYYTGMNVQEIAEEIYAYTSGYPVLVSSICRHIDEKIAIREDIANVEKAWSKKGVEQAVAMILKEKSPLFESMAKQLDSYPELQSMIEGILYRGKRIPYSPEEKSISLGVMFGFLKEENGCVAIANRMFEMSLLNLFMAREANTSEVYTQGENDRIAFIKNNRLDMDLVLRKFVAYFSEICVDKDAKFVEAQGRRMFLLYLKPIINGTGNYYIEAQTRDARRTDVIVDYLGEQFIIELKIWRGNEYNERGMQQLADYLDYYHADKGYLLSFNFNQKKEVGVKEVKVGEKIIVEAVV